MTRLTGAALDRAVANAMGLKSVNNCEKWGEEMNSQWSDEVKERYIKDQAFYAECTARGIQIRLNTDTLNWEGHMTRPIGISVPHRRVEEDDDIQDYKKPWVGLPTVVILDIFAETVKTHGGGSMPDGQIAFAKAIEKALKERNT